MKILKVEGMHCEKCTARISKAFAEEGIGCEVNLAAKTVTVDESDTEKAVELLGDLGFDAE